MSRVNQRLEIIDEMRGMLASATVFYEQLKEFLEEHRDEFEHIDEMWCALSDQEGNFVPPRATAAPVTDGGTTK